MNKLKPCQLKLAPLKIKAKKTFYIILTKNVPFECFCFYMNDKFIIKIRVA